MREIADYHRAAINKFGKEINREATPEEAAIQGDLTWEVEKRPMHTPQGYLIPGKFGIYRTDKERDIDGFLGDAGSRHTVIQSLDVLKFGADIISADEYRKAHFEMAGYTGKGERAFALINLEKSFSVVEGDAQDVFLCMEINHGGGRADRVFLIFLRGACHNTMVVRMTSKGITEDGVFVVYHTKNALQRMMAARDLLAGSANTISSIQQKMKALAERRLTPKHVDIVRDLLLPKAAESASEAAKTRAEKRRAKFDELFERNDGDRGFRLVAGTAYNAFNAFTEYIDHESSVVSSSVKQGWTKDEIRADKALFGSGALQKERALEIVLDATKDAPRQDLSRSYSIPTEERTPNLLDRILAKWKPQLN